MAKRSTALAKVSEGRVAHDLRELTEILVTQHSSGQVGGLLGGEWGYGTEFTNATFELHPYYWGDCTCTFDEAESDWWDTHEHAAACYQQVIRNRGYLDYDDDAAADMDYRARDAHNKAIIDVVCAEMNLDPEHGYGVHCTCTHDADYAAWRAATGHDDAICAMERPNFQHKPTGTTVNWYKYLGRGMEIDVRGASWRDIFDDCLRSLTTPLPTQTS